MVLQAWAWLGMLRNYQLQQLTLCLTSCKWVEDYDYLFNHRKTMAIEDEDGDVSVYFESKYTQRFAISRETIQFLCDMWESFTRYILRYLLPAYMCRFGMGRTAYTLLAEA